MLSFRSGGESFRVPFVPVVFLICRRPVCGVILFDDSIPLRFELVRDAGTGLSLVSIRSTVISVVSRLVSGNWASAKRKGAHPPSQVDGLGGVDPVLFGHRVDDQHFDMESG